MGRTMFEYTLVNDLRPDPAWTVCARFPAPNQDTRNRPPEIAGPRRQRM